VSIAIQAQKVVNNVVLHQGSLVYVYYRNIIAGCSEKQTAAFGINSMALVSAYDQVLKCSTQQGFYIPGLFCFALVFPHAYLQAEGSGQFLFKASDQGGFFVLVIPFAGFGHRFWPFLRLGGR
jgi:hypothetical protein